MRKTGRSRGPTRARERRPSGGRGSPGRKSSRERYQGGGSRTPHGAWAIVVLPELGGPLSRITRPISSVTRTDDAPQLKGQATWAHPVAALGCTVITDIGVKHAGRKGKAVFTLRRFRGRVHLRRRHGRIVRGGDVPSLSDEDRRHLCELDFERSAVLLPPGCGRGPGAAGARRRPGARSGSRRSSSSRRARASTARPRHLSRPKPSGRGSTSAVPSRSQSSRVSQWLRLEVLLDVGLLLPGVERLGQVPDADEQRVRAVLLAEHRLRRWRDLDAADLRAVDVRE